MTIMEWADNVNQKFSLDGDVSLKDGFILELQFDSGKRRTWLRNSFVPTVFPELSIMLDNKVKDKNLKTEADRFKEWYAKTLRYGSLPFQITKIGFQRRDETKVDEKGIYTFIEKPTYDSWGHMIVVKFGLEETAIIPEIGHIFLSTNDGYILLTDDHYLMVTQEGAINAD